MKQLAASSKEEVARPLKTLARLIKADLAAGENYSETSVEYFRQAGEKLIEAKKQLNRGEWMDWLRDNFHKSANQAAIYMRLARQIHGGREFKSLRDMHQKMRTRHPAGLPAAIRRLMAGLHVDLDEWSEKDIAEREQMQLMQKLARQVIDAGYRALSMKLHPDKGGSNEAMRRLTEVRALLRKFATGGALLHE
jgi:hypothetical protein